MNNAVSDLLNAEPRDGDAPFSAHIAPVGSAFFALGAELEQDVFMETYGWSREEVIASYGAYDAASDFIILVDRARASVAGAVRVVRWSDYGFPTFTETSKYPAWGCSMVDAYRHHGWDEAPTRILDVATVALREAYRGNGMCSVAMVHATYLHSLQLGGNRWICLLEEAVMEMMIALGMRWDRLCEMTTQPHQGSAATVPLTITLEDAADSAMVLVDRPGKELLFHVADLVSLPLIDLTESGRFATLPSELR